MSKPLPYHVKNEMGEIINTVLATEEFMEENFNDFSLALDDQGLLHLKRNEGLVWRNDELADTDWIVPITDHPQHDAYIAYRQELRDWPSTDQFPDTRPISP